ncbi:MAG: cell division ATP-binding protein FtsE [Candidatus Altimarinota bacterium]
MHFSKTSLAYGNKTILRDLNFTIHPGEFLFFIGASGSGKTSVIKSMIGVLKPKNGAIYDHLGNNIYMLSGSELLSYRRTIGVIFQDFKLLPRKTVKENVAFAMEVSGYDNATIHKRVPEVLSQVGLLLKKDKFIESLSGGELQRTAIARALIHDPDMIIGDEPTGNLDPKNAEDIINILLKLNEQGKTIVISTHDDRLVNALKKRVIAFGDGKILSDVTHGTYNI